MREPRIITVLREHGPCTAAKLALLLGVDVRRVRIYIWQYRLRISSIKIVGNLTVYQLGIPGSAAIEHPPGGSEASP